MTSVALLEEVCASGQCPVYGCPPEGLEEAQNAPLAVS